MFSVLRFVCILKGSIVHMPCGREIEFVTVPTRPYPTTMTALLVKSSISISHPDDDVALGSKMKILQLP